MDNTARANIRAYVGATGSGKGVSVREYLKGLKSQRFAAWDPLSEYGAFCKVRTDDLTVVAREFKKQNFSVSYWPGSDLRKFAARFDIFCRLCYSAGDLDMLVEELAKVTTPSFAPMSWGRIMSEGRHRRLRIIGCTQRPARVDKDFLGAFTYLRVFTLSWPDDCQVMAKCLRAPLADVEALLTTEGAKTTVINYIERDKSTGKTTKGTMRIMRK